MNKLPFIQSGELVCVICEGPEEYDYLNRIKELGVWDKGYRVDLVNAHGNGSLPARYQDKFQNGSYDIVLVFCDTDRKPFEQYRDIKRKINEFHGNGSIADMIVIFGNPCTMQVIIQHWGEVTLQSSSKRKNASIIEEFTGIKKYDAHSDQRARMMQMIDRDNYLIMLERVSKMPLDDERIGSSNFDIFMGYLSKGDHNWIDEINKAIET